MQKILLSLMIVSIAACVNSPEGSTNNEGSGASVLPEKTGDTSRTKDSQLYAKDSLANASGTIPKDSTLSLTTADSAALGRISGKRKPLGDTTKDKK